MRLFRSASAIILAFSSSFATPSLLKLGDAELTSRSTSAITPEISTLAQSLLAKPFLVPGVSVGVVRLAGGSVVTEYGAWGNRTEEGDPADPEMITGIGSCSKAFLASAMGILIDDFANGRNVTALPDGLGSFNWDTKLQALFPGDSIWKLEDKWSTERANIRDLLSMVTGLTRNEFIYTREDTPVTLGQRFRYVKPAFELREQWDYINIMFIFSAEIISKYSGKTYQEFVKERIFDQLNMTSTTFSVQEANSTGHLSQSWTYFQRRIPIILEDPTAANLVAGAGGILSNAVDMSKWVATLLNRGVDPVTNRTIIPESAYNETTTARVIQKGNVTTDTTVSIIGYGMGWQRNSLFGHDVITHDGGIPGFVSSIMFFPEDNIGVVALLNTDGPWQDILPLSIASGVLGLNGTEVVSAALASLSSPSSSGNTPSTANCTKSNIPLESFAGYYTSPGYGNLTFCAPTAANASAYCNSTLSDFAALAPLDQNTLYAVSLRIVTHVSMQRTCTNADGTEALVLSLQSIYPNGYGRNTTAFSEVINSLSRANVECVVSHGKASGCGWMDIEVGPKTLVGSVEERAQVWWTKH